MNQSGDVKMSELVKQHDQLKKLAISAINDYENLKQMYDQNQVQYEELKNRLIDTEKKLHNLEAVLEPACEEYNQVNKKLEVEKVCREEAMIYASEMNKANKKLKRQSQMLLDQLDGKVDLEKLGTITDESEVEVEPESASQTSALNEKIQVLEDDISNLTERLRKSETERVAAVTSETKLAEKFKRMDTELRKACQRLHDHEQAAQNFQRTSVLAWGEFSELKTKLEGEVFLKQQAEMFAHKMLSERDASFRQSSILMVSAASDTRLMQALLEVEDLTKKLETERMEGKEKVKNLEETLETSGDNQAHDKLQSELETASSEVQRLHRAVEDLEEWKKKLVDENTELRSKLNDAEDKLRPPPPPPPPPCPAPFIRPAALVIKRRDPSQTPGTGTTTPSLTPPTPSVHELALKEMMQRIQSGKGLNTIKTPKTPPAEPKTSSPMEDLQKVLAGLSVKRRGSTDPGATSPKPSINGGGGLPPRTMPKPKASLPTDSLSSASMDPQLLQKLRDRAQISISEEDANSPTTPTIHSSIGAPASNNPPVSSHL